MKKPFHGSEELFYTMVRLLCICRVCRTARQGCSESLPPDNKRQQLLEMQVLSSAACQVCTATRQWNSMSSAIHINQRISNNLFTSFNAWIQVTETLYSASTNCAGLDICFSFASFSGKTIFTKWHSHGLAPKPNGNVVVNTQMA